MSTQAKVVGYCRACGKPLDETTVKSANGTIYCEEHIPAPVVAATPAPDASAGAAGEKPSAPATPTTVPPPLSPYTAPTYTPPPSGTQGESHPSPGLAFALGLIPGVGAIYNGQYAKGLVHVLIVGLLISILSNDVAPGFEPLIALLLAGFWAYMAFEAYHTAHQRALGRSVDEFSSLVPMRKGNRAPVAPMILIILGVVILLNNLEIFQLRQLLKFWPVVLIALGAVMLYGRVAGAGPIEGGDK